MGKEGDYRRWHFVHFRAGEVERLALERLCRRECTTVSEAMRLALREAVERRGLWPVAERLAQAEVGDA